MHEEFIESTSVKIAINHYDSGHDGCIIIAPGWFMTKDSKAFCELAQMLADDFDVIVMDFRGHGKSSGAYTFSQKEPSDLKKVEEYALKRYKKIYLMGFSLGGAIVLIEEANSHKADKIIAVSAPSSFEKIENHCWKKEAWIPTLRKCELKRWCSVRPSLFGLFSKDKTAPVDIIDKINIPVLLISGEKDPTVYCRHGEELYKKANEPKRLEIIKDGLHAEDLFLKDKEYFVNLCKNWLKE